MIVVGHSAGGWGTLALNSVPHPHISALINMAGGRGGHQGPNHDQNCSPEQLTTAAAVFGKTSSTPMLWIYAENDTYFPPVISDALYAAFSGAGGQAQFIMKPPYGTDGHGEFSGPGGTKIWGDDVSSYLRARQ